MIALTNAADTAAVLTWGLLAVIVGLAFTSRPRSRRRRSGDRRRR